MGMQGKGGMKVLDFFFFAQINKCFFITGT